MRDITNMTPAQIRQAAHEAIIREIGVTGLLKFLHDTSLGGGDYTLDRHNWLPQHSNAEELFNDIEAEIAAMKQRGELKKKPSA